MNGLGQSGAFAIPEPALAEIRADFAAARTDEAETREAIRATLGGSGYLLDPHTAVGVSVARRLHDPAVPMVTLATAHPAKFPAAVRAAAGVEPPLPPWLADLYNRPERYDVLDNDARKVETFVLERTQAV
jgi:threonine synthase